MRGESIAAAGTWTSVTTFKNTASEAERLFSSPLLTCQNLWPQVRNRPAARQRHREIELGHERSEHVPDAVLAADTETVDIRPPDKHGLRTERDRLDDVASRSNPRVEKHRHAVPDGVDDSRQRVERGDLPIDLASAVVAHDQAVDARFGGFCRIVGVQHTLEQDRAIPVIAQPAEIRPDLGGVAE